MNSSWFTHEQFMVMNFRKAGEYGHFIHELELVYLPVGKYRVYPRMVYRQAMAYIKWFYGCMWFYVAKWFYVAQWLYVAEWF